MIEKEDEGEPTCDPRLAALLAVHLVSQILEEAYAIADSATESGQPWQYISMLKNFRSGKLCDTDDEDVLFGASKGDNHVVNENKMGLVANVVATSTPQKVSDDVSALKAEASLIGQGDEETRQNDLIKSTSMFLNHLFDMSDVERVICEDTDLLQCNSNSSDLLTQAMTQIMESYVNTALGIAYSPDNPVDEDGTDLQVTEKSSSTDKSTYSFLSDAFGIDKGKHADFNIDENLQLNKHHAESYTVKIENKTDELVGKGKVQEVVEILQDNSNTKMGITAFENAYLSMNRDYDACSDDDEEPMLQVPKGMLQEVELMAAETSNDNLSSCKESEEKPKPDLAATSLISAAPTSSRKSTLVRRFRLQGSRILACIRGWWRRKTPGKRKEARVLGSVRGLCPLSPDARRRAASLLDNRQLRSPSPSHPVVWKYNTVNEALVNSSRWKDYAFEDKPDCE